MVEEALHACAEAVSRPLSFSPEGVSLEEAVHSPVYTPSAANWNKLAELNEEATALGLGNIIHFGPGVQQELDDQMITCGITEQVADMMLVERRNKIVDSLFVSCEQPILETPAP
jgi:hypothetical protein